MSKAIAPEIFTDALYSLLEESFEKTHGIFLDKDTSLSHSLASLSAEQASTPTVEGGSTIGAHVFHIIFYLDVIDQYIQGKAAENVDWAGSWKQKSFTPSEWDALKSRLISTYHRVLDRLKGFDDWNDEKRLGGALGAVAHTAFHLGAVRQMLLVVKKQKMQASA